MALLRSPAPNSATAIRLATPTGVDLHRHMASGVWPCLSHRHTAVPQRSGWPLPLGWTYTDTWPVGWGLSYVSDQAATHTGVDLHRHMASGVVSCLGQRSGWPLPLGWTMDMGGGWLIVLLYVRRNRRLIRDGSPGRPPTFTQFLSSDGRRDTSPTEILRDRCHERGFESASAPRPLHKL